jgi:N,N'-diacetyllegionaminate synthase
MSTNFPPTEPYVIAEVGGNHGGDAEKAKEYVRAAADTGVDSVKFQLYRAETLITRDRESLPLAGDEYKTQFERFKSLELDRSEWREIAALTEDLGMTFSASVFSKELADFAAELSPFIKIASGDLTNIPLLEHVNDFRKSIVLSTGFATDAEIREAVETVDGDLLTLLHCIGSYPTDDDDVNLAFMSTLRDRFDVPVGYSDHTIGTLAVKGATALGATVIEKHFTLDKSQRVGDHRLSANPAEMTEIVEDCNRIADMIGSGDRVSAFEPETDIKTEMRRSLATKRDLSAGETITEEDIICLRPETGIPPSRYRDVVGRELATYVRSNTILTDEHFA